MIDWNKRLAPTGTRLLLRFTTRTGTIDRPATLQDVRELLRAQGLEVTEDPVDWSENYPGRDEHLTRICLLQQRLADLRHRLRGSRLRRV